MLRCNKSVDALYVILFQSIGNNMNYFTNDLAAIALYLG